MLKASSNDTDINFYQASGYEPAVADKAINAGNIVFKQRFFSILYTLGLIAYFFLAQKKKFHSLVKDKRIAARIRHSFVRLGVTFIKLGQFISMRPDIFPTALIEEMTLLQDQVPPLDIDTVKAIVEREFNKPINSLFKHFDSDCIASASIGQVHRAVLNDGTSVAVKIQRPNLESIIYEDLGLMRILARSAQYFRCPGDWQEWLKLVDDFGRSLFLEMNYLQEGKHADKLRRILRNLPSVVIPKIYWHLSTKKILSQQLCPGTKIENYANACNLNVDIKRLCKQLVDAYLLQIFVHGYFHADPHCGNFAISNRGQLIIYDFGMVSHLTLSQRNGLINAISSTVSNDSQRFIAALEELGILGSVNSEVKCSLQDTVQPFLSYCQDSAKSEINMLDLENKLDELVQQQALKLPANLAYLFRTIASLEGYVRILNPEFNFVRAMKPFFKPSVLQKLAAMNF